MSIDQFKYTTRRRAFSPFPALAVVDGEGSPDYRRLVLLIIFFYYINLLFWIFIEFALTPIPDFSCVCRSLLI